MNTYRLITIDPLAISSGSINGFPARRTGDPSLFIAPDGYKYVLDEPLPEEEPDAGKRWVRVVTEDSYSWQQVVDTPPPLVEGVAEATKLTIMRNLLKLDKWLAFKAAIASLDEITQDAWSVAISIRVDDPFVIQYEDILKATLDLTEEEFLGLFVTDTVE